MNIALKIMMDKRITPRFPIYFFRPYVRPFIRSARLPYKEANKQTLTYLSIMIYSLHLFLLL